MGRSFSQAPPTRRGRSPTRGTSRRGRGYSLRIATSFSNSNSNSSTSLLKTSDFTSPSPLTDPEDLTETIDRVPTSDNFADLLELLQNERDEEIDRLTQTQALVDRLHQLEDHILSISSSTSLSLSSPMSMPSSAAAGTAPIAGPGPAPPNPPAPPAQPLAPIQYALAPFYMPLPDDPCAPKFTDPDEPLSLTRFFDSLTDLFARAGIVADADKVRYAIRYALICRRTTKRQKPTPTNHLPSHDRSERYCASRNSVRYRSRCVGGRGE